MRNEGLINGIIEISIAIVYFLLIRVLPQNASIVLTVFMIIGALIFYLILQNKKRNFLAPFASPDKQICSLISNYYEQMNFEFEIENKKGRWIYYIVIPFLLIITYFLYDATRELKMFRFVVVVPVVLVILSIVIPYINKLIVYWKIDSASSICFEVAKVEIYDASYRHQGKSRYTIFYVFVRSNGQQMKLRVPEYVFNSVLAQECNEGYLVKRSKGDGVYDVFELIPVRPQQIS